MHEYHWLHGDFDIRTISAYIVIGSYSKKTHFILQALNRINDKVSDSVKKQNTVAGLPVPQNVELGDHSQKKKVTMDLDLNIYIMHPIIEMVSADIKIDHWYLLLIC